jgi:hypothetical protein
MLKKLDNVGSIRWRVEPAKTIVGCTAVVINKHGRTVQIEDGLSWVTEGNAM